ncbi:MAG: bacteriocin [Bacteroidia bacterium]|nr:bacteriocin [Bacteroidia bacterium]
MFKNKKTVAPKAAKMEVLSSKELNAIQGGFEYKNIEVVVVRLPDEPIPDVTLQQIKP